MPVPEEGAAPFVTRTFSQVLSNWIAQQDDLLKSLAGRTSLQTLSDLVATCKAEGVEERDVSSAKFIKAVTARVRPIKDNKEWAAELVERLEQAVAVAYAPVSVVEAKVPAQPSKSMSEEEEWNWAEQNFKEMD